MARRERHWLLTQEKKKGKTQIVCIVGGGAGDVLEETAFCFDVVAKETYSCAEPRCAVMG